MNASTQSLLDTLKSKFTEQDLQLQLALDELTISIDAAQWLPIAQVLRDDSDCQFEQLIDLCGVDLGAYGQTEWATSSATSTGFSRGVSRTTGLEKAASNLRRFAVVYHFLSITNNQRIRVKVFAPDNEFPVVPSVVHLWNCANWYEREAFDLFGILFEGHPDLRRILTDYGFVGHPFRKDFPLTGQVEMRYDPARQRVVYEPVSIEPRTLVPRTIRTNLPEAQSDNTATSAEGDANA